MYYPTKKLVNFKKSKSLKQMKITSNNHNQKHGITIKDESGIDFVPQGVSSKSDARVQHLAIIMDGNGRWATQKGWPRFFGHFQGVKALYQIIKICSELDIPYLTVFAFSTENWKRPIREVSLIMKLMGRALTRYKKDFQKYQVRLHVLGDLTKLNNSTQKLFKKMMEDTQNHRGLNLIVAVNYGGRSEIVQAVRSVAKKIKTGDIKPEDINEDNFASHLPSSLFPPPDMIIRTGGVNRLSNFYMWGSAYSEIYISQTLWPDFGGKELAQALKHYEQTPRRFGALPSKINY